jgi:uncharacterized protein YdaU (DUF1376 family)
MKADIWMPLYIGDYLADTARLTTEQHGAYLLLLMDYWRSGRLPDNDQVLAQISKLTPDAWSNAKAMLIPFFSIEDGCWIHKRVEQEMAEAKVNQTKKHERAVKAAEARWKNATSNANAMLNECPSPSPSPSPVVNTIVVAKAPKATRWQKGLAIPDSWIEFCKKERNDIDPSKTFESFTDYWISVAGAKGLKSDWDATWRNWVRNQKGSTEPKKDAKMSNFWAQIEGNK